MKCFFLGLGYIYFCIYVFYVYLGAQTCFAGFSVGYLGFTVKGRTSVFFVFYFFRIRHVHKHTHTHA
jgi:hypothetical protein